MQSDEMKNAISLTTCDATAWPDARSFSIFGRASVTRTLWLRTVHQSWFIVPQVGTLVAGFQHTCGIIDNMEFVAWK